MKKKVVAIMLAGMMAFSFTACGSSSSNNKTSTEETSKETAPEEKEYVDDIAAVATNPDSYKGKYIQFYARVSTVEDVDDFYGVQAYVDLDYNNSVLIEIPKSIMSESPQPDDFISVDAKVEDSKEGENIMGVTMTKAYLVADSVEKTTYLDSFGKADTTWEFTDKTIDQNGVSIDVTKVEFAKDETRFYITATNNSSDNMSLWFSSAKVVQNGQQLERAYGNYYADYPDLSSDILPGASTSGIIMFDPMEPSALQLYIEGSSDNYDLDFEPYVFDLAQ